METSKLSRQLEVRRALSSLSLNFYSHDLIRHQTLRLKDKTNLALLYLSEGTVFFFTWDQMNGVL